MTDRILFITTHYQAKYFVLFLFKFLHCPTCFSHSPCLVWYVGNLKWFLTVNTQCMSIAISLLNSSLMHLTISVGSRVQIEFQAVFLYAARFCVGEVAYCEVLMTKTDISKERTCRSEFTRKTVRKSGLTGASSR